LDYVNNPKIIRAWCLYDWANSVYSLVVTSSLFPVFFGLVAINLKGEDKIFFFGFEVVNTALFSFCVSFSFLIAGISSPFLTAFADLGDYRKKFLRFFCGLGAISCMGLALFSAKALEIGMLIFILATFGYSSSIVFYNSYLPNIASKDQLDSVSARGFAMGYLGSFLLLVTILIPILFPSAFSGLGLSFEFICRVGFVLTGIWWLGFGLYSISRLPQSSGTKLKMAKFSLVLSRFLIAIQVIRLQPGLFRFLVAFFWFNTGVQTIMYLAAIFGDKELHLPGEKLILTILILQVVAIPGARGFAWLGKFLGSIGVLLIVGSIWIGVTVSAYNVSSEIQFYFLAGLVGLVMGGSQSMFRSVFTGFFPSNEHSKSALFGLFDFLEKISTVLGTLVFGILNQVTGNMRLSALALSVFFAAGTFFLWPLRKRQINKGDGAF
jgi:UMF1 family MFS transporter